MDYTEALQWVTLWFALFLLSIGIREKYTHQCYLDRTNERMAKEGYTAYRLPGSIEIYWARQMDPLLGPKSY